MSESSSLVKQADLSCQNLPLLTGKEKGQNLSFNFDVKIVQTGQASS